MSPIGRGLQLVSILLILTPAQALAGMPVIMLSDLARLRVQAISFFLFGFLACSWGIQRIWNGLRADFPRLPRLSYGRAVGLVTLWGALFLLVLTMISGARELMTPGAWRREGPVYKLQEASPSTPVETPQQADRRHRLDRLRVALWIYARGHSGQFPADDTHPDIPGELWHLPDPSSMRYLYVGGQTADQGESRLAWEPDLFDDNRLILLTNGQIRWMNSQEQEGDMQAEARK